MDELAVWKSLNAIGLRSCNGVRLGILAFISAQGNTEFDPGNIVISRVLETAPPPTTMCQLEIIKTGADSLPPPPEAYRLFDFLFTASIKDTLVFLGVLL